MINYLLRDISTPERLKHRCILLIFYDNGVRVSELVKIRISDIDFQGKTIRVIDKGQREEHIKNILGLCVGEALSSLLPIIKNNTSINLVNTRPSTHIILVLEGDRGKKIAWFPLNTHHFLSI